MSEHTIWTQWDDLNVPSKFKRLSPANTPVENSDLSEITFYVPTYMGGRPALELTKKMPKSDISTEMLRLARIIHPGVTFHLADICMGSERDSK